MIRIGYEAPSIDQIICRVRATRLFKYKRDKEGIPEIMLRESSRQGGRHRSYEAYQRGIRFFNTVQGKL